LFGAVLGKIKLSIIPANAANAIPSISKLIPMLVESEVDFASNRNLVIASVILVIGIGNLVFNLNGLGINTCCDNAK
jgi:xanthine/uracil permease